MKGSSNKTHFYKGKRPLEITKKIHQGDDWILIKLYIFYFCVIV